ncbi:VOC family protein [Chelativorans sp.]|uniref:VOC family protein n=1 Tax=Chelativorans sp. TaxID=2203393 RepID=UPI002811A078|nr:VOC family protein [Chelativorans sp.]
MKPRISVLTLAVSNLEKSLSFYRDGLGFPTQGIIGREFEHGAVAFFDLQSGLKLAIWTQDDLVHDTGLPKQPICSTASSIGHNVLRREDVDDIMRKARLAGAQVIKAPQDTFYGGYAGYFTDPDGHLWEIVWNPQMLPSD